MIFSQTKIKIKDEEHQVKLADNFLARSWGLSLKTQGKMLFKFPRETRAAIDMMLLSKPLHLYFIDKNQKIINIQKAQPWTKNPKTWKIYRPEQKYKYLLESFEQLNLEKDDQIKLSESQPQV